MKHNTLQHHNKFVSSYMHVCANIIFLTSDYTFKKKTLIHMLYRISCLLGVNIGLCLICFQIIFQHNIISLLWHTVDKLIHNNEIEIIYFVYPYLYSLQMFKLWSNLCAYTPHTSVLYNGNMYLLSLSHIISTFEVPQEKKFYT